MNSTFSHSWVFKNTGKGAWPKVQLKRVNGDLDLVATPRQFDQIVQPDQFASFVVDFKAPAKAGPFLAVFRLVHGDNIEFGEKASLDVDVKEQPVLEIPLLAFDNVEAPKEKVKEAPKISEKEIAMMRSQ